jgi:hypothetical protein
VVGLVDLVTVAEEVVDVEAAEVATVGVVTDLVTVAEEVVDVEAAEVATVGVVTAQ